MLRSHGLTVCFLIGKLIHEYLSVAEHPISISQEEEGCELQQVHKVDDDAIVKYRRLSHEIS